MQALFINIIAARLQQIPALAQLDTLGCKDYKLDKILQVLLHWKYEYSTKEGSI